LDNPKGVFMPTYEYKCLKCNNTFEVFQAMSAEPIKECPKCKGPVKRLIGSGLSPIFKGSGFYQTDYKNNSANSTSKKKHETSKGAKEETKKENKSSGSTESPKKE
jgi:putative FmdB family regulatory protein